MQPGSGIGGLESMMLLSGKSGEDSLKRGLFLGGGDAGDDMPGETAQNGRLICWQWKRADDLANNGDKGIAIEIAERSKPVAAAAKLGGFGDGHGFPVRRRPESLRLLIAIACGSMQSIAWKADLAIRRDDDAPIDRAEPIPFHGC